MRNFNWIESARNDPPGKCSIFHVGRPRTNPPPSVGLKYSNVSSTDRTKYKMHVYYTVTFGIDNTRLRHCFVPVMIFRSGVFVSVLTYLYKHNIPNRARWRARATVEKSKQKRIKVNANGSRTGVSPIVWPPSRRRAGSGCRLRPLTDTGGSRFTPGECTIVKKKAGYSTAVRGNSSLQVALRLRLNVVGGDSSSTLVHVWREDRFQHFG